MRSERIQFENREKVTLSARLDMPIDRHAHTFVLFAHCFTCSKDLKGVRNISRALTQKGFGLLRFDFTGLGQSEGQFEETDFSHNVQDLIDAVDYLDEHYNKPEILAGHSLGGAAVLVAASKLTDIQAVATIAAPASPKHIRHLFSTKLEDIHSEGEAELSIAGRSFTIKKQFLDDLEQYDSKQTISSLDSALLVLHSPQDQIVSIDNALKIYKAARHSKSYVSLDGADHLLLDEQDSLYVGDVIASWASRYIDMPEEKPLQTDHQVAARLSGEQFTTEIQAGPHRLIADEPRNVGGNEYGPSPYELVAAGLGACTSMTLRMYADRKDWPLEEVVVHLNHEKRHADDSSKTESEQSAFDHITRSIELQGPLQKEQKDRLIEIANKCPVHRTLKQKVTIETNLMDSSA